MYGKIFPDIFDSTLMADGGMDAVYVFMSMVVLKDKDGAVSIDRRILSSRLGIDQERLDAALKVLMAPDPDSNLPAMGGRRIVHLSDVDEVEGNRGYYVVNHEHYREKGGAVDKKEQATLRQQRKRARDSGVTDRDVSRTVTPGHTKNAHTDTDTDTDIEEDLVVSETPLPVDNSDPDPKPAPDPDPKPTAKADYAQDFEAAWQTRPKRAGSDDKRLAYRAWKARLAEGHTPEEMIAGWLAYRAYLEVAGKIGTEFVMQGATFLGPADPPHFDHDWALPKPEATNGISKLDDNKLMALAQRYRVGTGGKSREQLGADIRKAAQAERDEAPKIDLG